jgi:DNA-binding NtrC family response regulator
VAAVPQGIASRFERYSLAGGSDKPAAAQEANIVPFELRKTMSQMLGDVIALLAMKHRRAPVPVSSALLRTLWMRGFPENLAELESFARRLLFLGDERMLLSELRRGRAPIVSRPENSQGPSGIALGQRTETKRGQ